MTTSPCARRYTGVFRAFFVKVSFAPAAILMVVQWNIPSGGRGKFVSAAALKAPQEPLLPASNATAARMGFKLLKNATVASVLNASLFIIVLVKILVCSYWKPF